MYELIELTLEREKWFDTPRRNGFLLLKNYASTDTVSPSSLDIAFDGWTRAADTKKPPKAVVGYGLGVLFGDYMIEKKGGKWMEAAKGQGFELAVLFKDEKIAFPIDSVWKRMPKDANELTFFEPIWRSMNGENIQ